MLKKKWLISSLFSLLLLLSSFSYYNLPLITSTKAEGILPQADGSGNTSGCDGDANYCGNYELNDFVELAINVSQLILGLVGSLTLIMFVYGGVMFLISGGSSDKIAQAKKIMIAAVVGLVIVFSSWLIIKFVTETLGARTIFNGEVK